MNTELFPGTLEWYREKGKTDQDIAALVAMIDRMQSQLAKSLESVAALTDENINLAKSNYSQQNV